jgi:NlpC/P60 family
MHQSISANPTGRLRQQPPTRLYYKLLLALWMALWPLTAAAFWQPINNIGMRLLIVSSTCGLWSGTALFFWRRRMVRYTCFGLVAAVALFLALPGRASDPAALRDEYVHALARYEGTRYVWGGENGRGIDCSGLIRRGLIDASLKRGIATANPALVRTGVSLWWHDCSAKALKEEYRAQTKFVLVASDFNGLDHSRIRPGDMAVTANGVHILAYLGDRVWIEADPNALVGDKVIAVRVPAANPWFGQPVHIIRWRQLETA